MKRLIGVVLLALLAGTFIFAGASPAQAVNTAAGRVVSDDPANFTPHATDGRVNSIVQVGDTIVMGGTFTTVRNNSTQTTMTRNRLVAFNATTGVISTTFNPNANGEVNVVLPASDGTSVYVGGTFTTLNGVAAKYLARVRLSDGSIVTTFNGGSPTGAVQDLRLIGNRLYVAGAFTHIQNRAQKGLATLNATTGAYDSFFNKVIAGQHNGGTTGIAKIDVTPQGDKLIAIGNFLTVDSQSRRQLFMLNLSGSSAQVANWQTSFYEGSCASVFNSYMRDLDVSPDGKFFVVSTTGAYGGPDSPCDNTARWEFTKSGTGIKPSWVNYTGGDTTYAVEITDSVVYTGGHARWQNNTYAGDSAGPGAVARPGIAALSPDSGIPFSWNPTRNRGVGVFDMLATSQGLWARLRHRPDRPGVRVPRPDRAVPPCRGCAVPGRQGALGAERHLPRRRQRCELRPERALPGQRRRFRAARQQGHRLERRHQRVAQPVPDHRRESGRLRPGRYGRWHRARRHPIRGLQR